jgi:hypothetical protein
MYETGVPKFRTIGVPAKFPLVYVIAFPVRRPFLRKVTVTVWPTCMFVAGTTTSWLNVAVRE